jgi:hypothetical protein
VSARPFSRSSLRGTPMRKYLREWDRDVFEMELAEQRLLDALNANLPFTPRTEGYDPNLDEPNGYEGSAERERLIRGES